MHLTSITKQMRNFKTSDARWRTKGRHRDNHIATTMRSPFNLVDMIKSFKIAIKNYVEIDFNKNLFYIL